MSEGIRIILVDRFRLFRRGLTELLSRRYGMVVVGATDNLDDLTALLRKKPPDLIVMGLRMQPVDGLNILERLRQEDFLTPVVILTMSDAESDLANALRAGVRGYLLKDMTPDDVANAIHRVAAGELVVAPAMTEKMIRILQNNPQDETGKNAFKSLTKSEYKILQLVANGGSNKAIALKLGISCDTVKQHVRNILTKLHLSSRVEAAVMFAIKIGNSSDQ